MAAPKPRLLLLGFDAADWRIATPLLDAGRLPFLAQLIAGGVIGNLNTLSPPIPAYLWTSLVTGQYTSRHGITSPLEPDPAGTGVRPTISTSRQTPALWTMLADRGLRTAAVHWPVSHPAESVTGGVMVSEQHGRVSGIGFDDWPLPPDCVRPTEYREIMADLRMHPAEITGEQLRPLVPLAHEIDQTSDRRLSDLAHHVAAFATTHAAGTWLAERNDWDLLLVHYSLHRDIGRDFAHLRARREAGDTTREVQLYGDVVDHAYEMMDAALGRYMGLVGRETTILLVSEHGHVLDPLQSNDNSTAENSAHGWPRMLGLFLATGPGLKSDDRVYGARLLDIAPTVLALLGQPGAKDFPGRILTTLWTTPPEIPAIDSYSSLATATPPALPPAFPAEAHAPLRQCAAQRLSLLAQEYLGRGNMAEALRWSRELCELEAAPAHRLLRAQVLLQARQAAEAQTLVQPLLADPIWAVDARLALCHAALQTGDYAEAGRRLAEISPAEVTPAVLQMMVTYERARGAWDDCMVRCRQVLALDPECYWAKSALGACLFHAGRTEEAIEQLQHSVGLLHGQADAHLHLGQALQKLGHDEWAERAYQTTLTIDSLQPEAHEGLGAIYRTRDQPVLASRHYEQAMAIRRHLQQRHGGRPAGA